jgi:hypothetical protein
MTMERLKYFEPVDDVPYYLYDLARHQSEPNYQGETSRQADYRAGRGGPFRLAEGPRHRPRGGSSAVCITRSWEDRCRIAGSTVVKRRAEPAGLEGDYSPHSIRMGFMTESRRQRMHPAEAKMAAGHRSLASVMEY